jgi:hypothetical protein
MKLVLGALTGLALAVPVSAHAQDPPIDPTPTATATSTATATASPTATATATITATPTATATETATATPTATATATEVPTEVPTEAPTAEPTPDETEPPVEDEEDINPPDNGLLGNDVFGGGFDVDDPFDIDGSDGNSDKGTNGNSIGGSSLNPGNAKSNVCMDKRTVLLTLPRSYRNVKVVRATVGKRAYTVRLLAGRKLRVRLMSKRTNVVVRKKGRPTVKHTYTLCAKAK